MECATVRRSFRPGRELGFLDFRLPERLIFELRMLAMVGGYILESEHSNVSCIQVVFYTE